MRDLTLFIFSNRDNYLVRHLFVSDTGPSFDAWSRAALTVESFYDVSGLVLLIGLRLEWEDEEDYVVRQTTGFQDQR